MWKYDLICLFLHVRELHCPSSQILINDHIKNLSAGQTDTHHVPQTDPNWFSTIYNHCTTFCMVEKLFKICSIKNNSTINQDFMPNLFFIFYFIEKIRILNEFIFEKTITNNKFLLLKNKFNVKNKLAFRIDNLI